MEQREALQLVHRMLVAWPRLALEKEQIAFFAEQLLDLPAQAANAALVELARTNTFPPSIAEFRKKAVEKASGESADSAWRLIQASAEAAGSGSIDFPDDLSLIARDALEEVGGYYRLRFTETPQYLQKDFAAAYERRQREKLAEHGAGLTMLEGGTSGDERQLGEG